jgi:hypothetical protein
MEQEVTSHEAAGGGVTELYAAYPGEQGDNSGGGSTALLRKLTPVAVPDNGTDALAQDSSEQSSVSTGCSHRTASGLLPLLYSSHFLPTSLSFLLIISPFFPLSYQLLFHFLSQNSCSSSLHSSLTFFSSFYYFHPSSSSYSPLALFRSTTSLSLK